MCCSAEVHTYDDEKVIYRRMNLVHTGVVRIFELKLKKLHLLHVLVVLWFESMGGLYIYALDSTFDPNIAQTVHYLSRNSSAHPY